MKKKDFIGHLIETAAQSDVFLTDFMELPSLSEDSAWIGLKKTFKLGYANSLKQLIKNYILSRVRIRIIEFALDMGNFLLSSPRITILSLSKQDFQETWELFKKYAKIGLSFTDCSILVQCRRIDCQYVATYDSHFKGLIGTNLTLK